MEKKGLIKSEISSHGEDRNLRRNIKGNQNDRRITPLELKEQSIASGRFGIKEQ